MTDWLIQIEGTEAGHRLALILALSAAVLHAVFGALQKGRHDPFLTRGAIDACYCLMAAPFALFVVPWPEPKMWPIFAGAWVIHMLYKFLQAAAYTKGAYTVVYPVVRGTGPLFTVIGAYLIFGETFTLTQWLGVGVLMAGIFGLAVYNLIFLTAERETLNAAMGLAVLTGLFVALYTTYDAVGIIGGIKRHAQSLHLPCVVLHDRRGVVPVLCGAAVARDADSARAGTVGDAWRDRRCRRLHELWRDHDGDTP